MTQTLVATAEQAPPEADIAFEQLYRSSRDDVYAYAAGILRDRAAAEEVTATAFERAYRKRRVSTPGGASPAPGSSASPATPPSTSCAGAAGRLSWQVEPADAAALAAPERLEASERRVALDAALSTLSAGERELIALKFFAGLGNAEIAAVLGTSESNAGTKLHRAMAKLREACDEAL